MEVDDSDGVDFFGGPNPQSPPQTTLASPTLISSTISLTIFTISTITDSVFPLLLSCSEKPQDGSTAPTEGSDKKPQDESTTATEGSNKPQAKPALSTEGFQPPVTNLSFQEKIEVLESIQHKREK